MEVSFVTILRDGAAVVSAPAMRRRMRQRPDRTFRKGWNGFAGVPRAARHRWKDSYALYCDCSAAV